jgi:hypothetical protein
MAEVEGVTGLDEILDFESIYKHLEEKAVDYKHLHEIANLFQKIRDKMHENQKTDEETKAQWEMDIFNFSIEENAVKPLFTGVDEKGETISYPNYGNFVEATYDYIIKRLTSTANPLLKARYAHILWFSPKKHGKYAEMAIDAYLELIKLYEQKDKERPNEHSGLYVINATKNAFFLSLNIKDAKRLNFLKSEVRRLIFNFNSESSSLFILRADLINLMLSEKSFSKDDFVGMSELCLNFAKRIGDSHQSIVMLELGEKIDQKLETTTCNWKELIGESYEKMMRLNIEKNKHVAITFCQDALKYYRQIKDSKKIGALEKTYNELKGALEFKEFRIELNVEEYIKECEIRAKEIAQHSSEEILSLLIVDKHLLPTYNEMKKLAEETLKEHPIQLIFPIEIIDERGHNVQYFTSEEEIIYYRTLQQYKMCLENQYLPQINAIVLEALKERKMTYPFLMDFFRNHSWFGKTIKKKIQNQEIMYNWLSLLAPSLLEYFKQMEYLLASGKYPNLILCIDSLILKIEGLLRDLCNYSGITTFFPTKDKQGRTVYQEKDLNALLHEERMKEVFDDDDLLLFKFVLVEKVGYNLRHKIAHSLIFFSEYCINYVHLLILLLLRLGKFDFEQKQN